MIRILTSLVAVFVVAAPLQAQSSSVRETPKLVIGITIDQLRGDYLEMFQQNFSDRGFKRLLNEGLVYENVSFNIPNLDDVSAITTIYTGTTPFYHGILANKKYITKEKREIQTFADEDYLGNYTQEKVSPLAIKASTITDELKMASLNSSDIYSLAPLSAQALITAGQLGNCGFWIDDYSGKWASTTYYRDFYWVVDAENKSNTSYSAQKLGKYWNPLLDAKQYNALPYLQGIVNFQHNLEMTNQNSYALFKKSPYANECVRDMAIKILTKADMGKRLAPDFLSLTFYAGNFPGIADYSIEIQDTYTRLDRDIEALLDAIDKSVGLKNAFIFITSTGYYDSNEEPDLVINRGSFHINRCEALLNMYLMAIYGTNSWVDKFYNNQIYLNRKLIEDQNIPLQEIQRKSAEFIAEFTGVQEVYTSYDLMHGEWNPMMEYYRNGYSKETSGDLYVELQPGYKILNDQDKSHKVKVSRNNAVVCPVIFFGSHIKPERIKRTIKATEIAPSVAHVLRIRPPNAAKDNVLSELF
ncbi:alkaline phosphatase family protein [Dysgonomonas sp. 25]|uniref:alkaline phosphatase family protein n=1 Tax=Dysgonomonas sp. 25 TaxID=2302933 RepID=UPI0013D458D7|nr:alkaline phosphatase family protein [Dysgonomonas sp. 25]NDV67552.1 alkaline phosphatase family protein [Dysgonomonas sp. 25]